MPPSPRSANSCLASWRFSLLPTPAPGPVAEALAAMETDELPLCWAMKSVRHSRPSAPSSVGEIGRLGGSDNLRADVVELVRVGFGGRADERPLLLWVLGLTEEESEAVLLGPLEVDGPALPGVEAVPEKTRWRCREPRPRADRDDRAQSGAVEVEAVGCLTAGVVDVELFTEG